MWKPELSPWGGESEIMNHKWGEKQATWKKTAQIIILIVTLAACIRKCFEVWVEEF